MNILYGGEGGRLDAAALTPPWILRWILDPDLDPLLDLDDAAVTPPWRIGWVWGRASTAVFYPPHTHTHGAGVLPHGCTCPARGARAPGPASPDLSPGASSARGLAAHNVMRWRGGGPEDCGRASQLSQLARQLVSCEVQWTGGGQVG